MLDDLFSSPVKISADEYTKMVTLSPTDSYSGNVSAGQLFSYYPKYEFLDSMVSNGGKRNLCLYVDVKGCGNSLFQEWAVKHILAQSTDDKMDLTFFTAVCEFVAFHKKYARKRNINLKIVFFMESGTSSYHKSVDPEYKMNRSTTDFFGLDSATREKFFQILDRNYFVMDKILNKIPNVSFYRLSFLEADFIPWYIMNHSMPRSEFDDTTHIIYSLDKDMLQCLNAPNVFQFYRHYKKTAILTQNDIFKHWIKTDLDCCGIERSDWFPLALSIVGDSSDNIHGVGGIAQGTIVKIFDQVMTFCDRSMNNVYQKMSLKEPIFRKYDCSEKSLQKILLKQDIIAKNLKLCSFRYLSYEIDNTVSLTLDGKKKQIADIYSFSEKCPSSTILYDSLVRSNMYGVLKDDTITSLFIT